MDRTSYLKKSGVWMFVSLILFINTYAVEIYNTSPPLMQETGHSIAVTIITIFLMVSFALICLGGFFFICLKIYQKVTEHYRRKKHLVYDMFVYDLQQCHYNHDRELKKRNWKLFFLFWNRQPIHIERRDGSLDVIGYYHGETTHRNGLYLLAIYNKLGMFKYVGQILVIPYTAKNQILKKITHKKSKLLILNIEGVDTMFGSDYYLHPLILKNEKEFIDFSDEIFKGYIEVEAYRDLLLETLHNYREGIIRSVEANPNIHFKRRGGTERR